MGQIDSSRRRGFTFIDLMVCLAVVALLLAMLPAIVQRSRAGGERVSCARNLRSIGQAIMLYANETVARGSQYPRTTWDRNDRRRREYTGANSDEPFGATGPAPNDVTAAMFLLLRTQDISGSASICPSDAQANNSVTPIGRSNFLNRTELSYSIADPYPDQAATDAGYHWGANSELGGSEFALAADMNPGVQSLLAPVIDASPRMLRRLNSLNHARDGQNVLYSDGHIDWTKDPFVSIGRDNIYTAGPSGGNRLTPGTSLVGPPSGPTDSIMQPAEVGAAELVVQPELTRQIALLAAGLLGLLVVLGLAWWFAFRGRGGDGAASTPGTV